VPCRLHGAEKAAIHLRARVLLAQLQELGDDPVADKSPRWHVLTWDSHARTQAAMRALAAELVALTPEVLLARKAPTLAVLQQTRARSQLCRPGSGYSSQQLYLRQVPQQSKWPYLWGILLV
jgi:hypothetical protein